MRARRKPLLLLPGAPLAFPDPEPYDDEGLVAVGGDLEPERLLHAYEHGIFPWYEGLPPMWWSPSPRAVFTPERLHVSRSLRRVLRSGRFECSANRAFGAVIRECGRERESGTWILPEMIAAYEALHALGHAHSFEVWQDGELVGGLYGVQCGALFAAESMFHRATDASKVALVNTVTWLFAQGLRLFDVQFLTPHLESLGAHTILRSEYLERARAAAKAPCPLPLADFGLPSRAGR